MSYLRVCTRGICVFALTVLVLGTGEAVSDVYSVDVGSPSVGLVPADPADVLCAGLGTHVLKANLGLGLGGELDALSAGLDIVTQNDVIHFSVDRKSFGAGPFFPVFPGGPSWDVAGQAALGHQAGDVFVTVNKVGVHSPPTLPAGMNYLDVNNHQFGLIPMVGMFPPLEPNDGPQDNLDAYSMEEFDFSLPGDMIQDVPVFFSLAVGSPSLGLVAGATGDDILVSTTPGSFGVFMDGVTDIGLAGGDDIDALALYTGGEAPGPRGYFSLSRTSPTLLGVDGAPGLLGIDDDGMFGIDDPGEIGLGDDLSAADIFYTDFSGGFGLAFAAESLGLRPTDNVDALETNALPEPSTLALLLVIPASLVRSRRRPA